MAAGYAPTSRFASTLTRPGLRSFPEFAMGVVPDDAGPGRADHSSIDTPPGKETSMSVAKVIELTATSQESFEDAIRQAITKASETVRSISGAWVKEQKVTIEDGRITGFRVDLKVTFVLD
jgi:flavin-binding protein dodecin